MKKNLFFTFWVSLVPGSGQMYQAYMKRGLSIMVIFALFILLAVILQSAIFFIPLPIIWVYSFFDTYNLRNYIGTDNEKLDAYIWGNIDMFSLFENVLQKKSYFIGILLIFIGLYLILNNILANIAFTHNIEWLSTLIRYSTRYLPVFIISILSIGVGIKLMFNKNVKEHRYGRREDNE